MHQKCIHYARMRKNDNYAAFALVQTAMASVLAACRFIPRYFDWKVQRFCHKRVCGVDLCENHGDDLCE